MRPLIVGTLIVLALLAGLWFWQRAPASGEVGAPPHVGGPAAPLATTAAASLEAAAGTVDGRVQVPGDTTAGVAASAASAPQCILTGRVTDARGVPIAGAKLELDGADGWDWSGSNQADTGPTPAERRAVSGDDGRFRIACSAPAGPLQQLRITAEPDWCANTVRFGSGYGSALPLLAAGERDIGDFLLRAAGSIAGRVVDPELRPIPGAILAAPGGGAGVRPLEAVTGGDGAFELGGMAEGDAEYSAFASGFVSRHDLHATIVARTTTQVGDIVLARAFEIRGVLVDEAGQPVYGVHLRAESAPPREYFSATSRADGTFELTVNQDVLHTLSVRGSPRFEDWGGPAYPAAQVSPGAPELRIALRRRPEILFLVLDDRTSAPIERFGHFLRAKLPPGSSMSISDSAFDEADHPRGELRLPASDAAQEILVCATGYAAQTFDVREDAPGSARQTLRLRPESAVAGRVSLQGAPLAGALAYLCRESLDLDGKPTAEIEFSGQDIRHDVSDMVGRMRGVTTDSAGGFHFGGLDSGTYRVLLKGSSTSERWLRGVHVAAGSVTDLGEIRLTVGARIDGRLIPPNGLTAAGFLVMVLGANYNREFLITDPGGSFVDDGLTAGEHIVSWLWPDESHDGWSTADARTKKLVLAEGERSALVLDTRPFARCEVQALVLRAGEPVADAAITVRTFYQGRISHWGRPFGRTDALGKVAGRVDGGLEFELVLGEYGPLAVPFGGRHTATAGGRLELRLEVEAGTIAVELPAGFELPTQGELGLDLRWSDQLFTSRRAQTPDSQRKYNDSPEWTARVHDFGLVQVGDVQVSVLVQRLEADPPGSGRFRTVPVREPYTTRVTVRNGERTVVKLP